MNREEIANLLKILSKNYQKRISPSDAKTLVDSWELTLGAFTAEEVYKAARLHMETSPFFPNPADIRKNIVRASVAYSEEPKSPARLTSIAGAEPIEDEKLNEWLDAFCEWIGFGCEPNEDALGDYYDKNPEMMERMKGVFPNGL